MTEKELRKVFHKQLAPLRDALFAEVDSKPDPAATSYFLPLIGKENVIPAIDMEESLSARWALGAPPGVSALIPTVTKMMKGLRAPKAERGEVSSLIYPMY